MSEFTKFQLDCETTIQKILETASLVVARSEFSDPLDDNAKGIKLTAAQFAFWIYGDGAQLDHCGRDRRFEIESYASLDELQSHYLREVRKLVGGSC